MDSLSLIIRQRTLHLALLQRHDGEPEHGLRFICSLLCHVTSYYTVKRRSAHIFRTGHLPESTEYATWTIVYNPNSNPNL